MHFVCVRLWSVSITLLKVRKYKNGGLVVHTTNWGGRSVKIWRRNKHQEGWVVALACLYQERADRNSTSKLISLTCAIATNLLFLLNTSLRSQRRNFLLCLQMTTLLSLLGEFSSVKAGLLQLPFQPCMKESPSQQCYFFSSCLCGTYFLIMFAIKFFRSNY